MMSVVTMIRHVYEEKKCPVLIPLMDFTSSLYLPMLMVWCENTGLIVCSAVV